MERKEPIEAVKLTATLATVGAGVAQRLGIDPAGKTADEILAGLDARIEAAGERAREAEARLKEALGEFGETK